jgi:hypothetical protein
MEWMVEEMVEMDIDWCVVVESREHAYLADLMESLKMGCGADANIEMEDVDTLEEELEHTILDNIIQEWEVEVDNEMEEGVMKDCNKGLDVGSGVGIDEFIQTITCKGNCSGSCHFMCLHWGWVVGKLKKICKTGLCLPPRLYMWTV